MAYDPATDQLLLFGGSTPYSVGDTWTWDGTTWTELSPATSPTSRYNSSMAYDPAAGQLVLFGGFTHPGFGAGGLLGDTWTWDGTTWTELSPATIPSARQEAYMAYDPATDQLLLFGGVDYYGNPFNDTWVYQAPVASTLTTTPNPTSVTLGSTTPPTLTDSAVLSGGDAPTGSITFTLYYGTTLVDTESVTVSGNGTYTTPTGYTLPTTGTVSGTYQWDASYSGDTNNSSVPDISDPSEVVTVSPAVTALTTTPNPTSVTLGSTTPPTLTDSAVLSGGDAPTGSITFTLYYGTTLVDTESVTVSGNGTYTTPTGYTLPTTGTVSGTYQWDASYSGDTNNSSVPDISDPSEVVTVSPAVTALTTTPNPTSVTLGSTTPPTLTDSAVLSGGDAPTGSITFTLYYGTTLVDTESVTVSGNGTYTTPTGYTLPTTGTVSGTYQWDASYSGDTNNSSVPDISDPSEVVTVVVGSQTISWTAPASGTVGGSATLSATGGASGNPVVFSVDATSGAGVCNVSGTNGTAVNYTAAGSCVIDANQAGNSDYAAAPEVQATIPVSATKASQTITFAALVNKTLAQSPVTVSATASSGLTVSFTTTTPAVCTSGGTNGATITLLEAGTCTVRASQAGNATYNAAPSVNRSFTVSKASQTITFAALVNKTLAQSPVTVSATASSGLTVSFTTTTPAVCTSGGTNGATITLLEAGTCTVRASQAGNATYNAAPSVNRSFTVSKASQTITFAALVNKTLAQSPVTVSATASSGLTVSFTTTTPAVCTSGGTNGATITLLEAGISSH